MKKALLFLSMVLFLALGAFAQQTTPLPLVPDNRCFDYTLSVTATRTVLFRNSNGTPIVARFTYYTTGSPTGVSISIEGGNVAAATQTPSTLIAAVTNTTGADMGAVAEQYRYWYANLATLTGGTTPTVRLTACVNRDAHVLFNTTASVTGLGSAQAANSVWASSNNLNFEGATADAFETAVTPTDPTADRTQNLPNQSGTHILSAADQELTTAIWGTANGLIYEGTTADAFETTVSAADPTVGDTTLTIPNTASVAGSLFLSTLTTNSFDIVNSLWGASNALVFEGATADAFELSVAPTNVGADVTATLPGGGNAAYAILGSALTTNDVDVANSVWGVSNGLRFEGATADAFETTISPTDVGADVAMTLPGCANAACALIPSTLATNDVEVANSVWGGTSQIILEGATADGFETIITPTDATADVTVTIPNAAVTGTITLGQIEVTFHDEVTGNATDRTFFLATRGYIVTACSQIHSVAAGGVSTLQVTKETTTGAPGTGTDLLTAAFDLNATANTVQAKTSGDFVSLAARTMAAGDRLSVDYANAIQATAGNMVTCSLMPN